MNIIIFLEYRCGGGGRGISVQLYSTHRYSCKCIYNIIIWQQIDLTTILTPNKLGSVHYLDCTKYTHTLIYLHIYFFLVLVSFLLFPMTHEWIYCFVSLVCSSLFSRCYLMIIIQYQRLIRAIQNEREKKLFI